MRDRVYALSCFLYTHLLMHDILFKSEIVAGEYHYKRVATYLLQNLMQTILYKAIHLAIIIRLLLLVAMVMPVYIIPSLKYLTLKCAFIMAFFFIG